MRAVAETVFVGEHVSKISHPVDGIPDHRAEAVAGSAVPDDDRAVGGDGPGGAKEGSAGQVAEADHAGGLGPAEGLRSVAGRAMPDDDGSVEGNGEGLAGECAAVEIAEAHHVGALGPAKGLITGCPAAVADDGRSVTADVIGDAGKRVRLQSECRGRSSMFEDLVQRKAWMFGPRIGVPITLVSDDDFSVGGDARRPRCRPIRQADRRGRRVRPPRSSERRR